jgi:cysteinyl-tRNA synthetase
LDHVAPRLVAQGADGFFLDNLELIEHGRDTTNGPCDERCVNGGLRVVRELRRRYPDHLIVMQNATSDVTRLASIDGLRFAELLDGISHEDIYSPGDAAEAEAELRAWQAMRLLPGGRPFWIGTEDYVGTCSNETAARGVISKSRALGFSPYIADKSEGQRVVCWYTAR